MTLGAGTHAARPPTRAARRRRGGDRPFTRLGIAGLAAHVFLELGAGVGMPLASLLGPSRAAALWAGSTFAAGRAAGRGAPRHDRAFALVNGSGLAVVIAHLTGWPRRPGRLGAVWLADCEGLGPAMMKYYNPVLHASAAAAAIAMVRERGTAHPVLPLLPVLAVPAARRAQHAEHRRLLVMARQAPAWWNRRLRQSPSNSSSIRSSAPTASDR